MLAKPAVKPRARGTAAARRMHAPSSPVAAAGNGNGSSSSGGNAGGGASSSSSASSSASSASSAGTAFDPRLSSDEIELWDDNGGPPTPLLVSFCWVGGGASISFSFAVAAGQTSAAYREKNPTSSFRYRFLLLSSLLSLFSHSLPRPRPLSTLNKKPLHETGHCQLPRPPQEPLPPAAPPALQRAPQRHHPHRLQDGGAPRRVARRD